MPRRIQQGQRNIHVGNDRRQALVFGPDRLGLPSHLLFQSLALGNVLEDLDDLAGAVLFVQEELVEALKMRFSPVW